MRFVPFGIGAAGFVEQGEDGANPVHLRESSLSGQVFLLQADAKITSNLSSTNLISEFLQPMKVGQEVYNTLG